MKQPPAQILNPELGFRSECSRPTFDRSPLFEGRQERLPVEWKRVQELDQSPDDPEAAAGVTVDRGGGVWRGVEGGIRMPPAGMQERKTAI